MKRLIILLIIFCPALLSFKKKEITWVAIGDSITYLNDHKDETGYRLTKGYLTRVTESISNLKYINKGYNGWTSGNIANKIDSLGLNKADIYTVFLGTNDWWQGRPLGTLNDYKLNTGNHTVNGSFRIIINKLRSLNPQAVIVLITPMKRADFYYINGPANNAYGSQSAKNGQYLESFANTIDSIGRLAQIPVIDLYHDHALPDNKLVKYERLKDPATGQYVNWPYPKSKSIPFDPKTDDYPYPPDAINLTYDGLHPSDKGCSIIAKRIVHTFREFGYN